MKQTSTIAAGSREEALMSVTSRDRLTVGGLVGRLLGNTTSAIAVVLLIICVVLSLLSDRFLTAQNIYSILAQSAVVGVAAVGGTFVIITGGIDLSVGAVIGLAGMIGALVIQAGYGAEIGILVTLGVGVLVGAVNGLSVSMLRLAPFIVTLATMGMAQGLTLESSAGKSVYDLPRAITFFGGDRIFGGLPVSVIVTVIIFIIGQFLLTGTSFGKSVFAVGGNREAARLAGINVNRVLLAVYLLAGLCAGIAAILTVGRIGAATPTSGAGVELRVIAAIVIGGTSLFGGKGSLWGTLVGVLLIGVINNGLTLLNVDPFLVQFMQSALIFAAVLFDALNTRRLARNRMRRI